MKRSCDIVWLDGRNSAWVLEPDEQSSGKLPELRGGSLSRDEMLEKAGARYYDHCACFGGVSVEAEFRFRFRFEHLLVKNVIAMLVTDYIISGKPTPCYA